jgi:hypothetical protein
MATDTMELPRISIKTDVKKAEARPFVGRVVADAIQPGKYDVEKKPYQWAIAVQPLKSADGTAGFQIGGKTGAFWEYVSITTDELGGDIKDSSKFGRHFNAFRTCSARMRIGRLVAASTWIRSRGSCVRRSSTARTARRASRSRARCCCPRALLSDEEMVQYGLAAGSVTAPATEYETRRN